VQAFDDPVVRARLKFVLSVVDGDISVSEAADQNRISRSAVREYVRRFEKSGAEGLRNRPRGRYRPTPTDIEEEVLRLKRERRSRSCRKIRDLLKAQKKVKVHRQTVHRILRKHGEHRRELKQLKPDHDFEYPEPNDCWQIDIMDGIVVKGLGLVYLHSTLDDHSRYSTGSDWFTGKGSANVLSMLKDGFEVNGLPKRIIADRGTEFKDSLGRGITQYERVLARLGIDAIYASVGNAKTKGKLERFHRFVQEDFLQEHEFKSLDDLRRKWKVWLRWYNTEHEHEGLDGASPGERYARVRKRSSPFPLEDVFATIVERKVRMNATVKFKKNVYPVDPKYMRERVELRVLNGVVRIYHGATLLGTFESRIDYRERMLRRIQFRSVKRDGTVRFAGKQFRLGLRLAGRRVEVMRKGKEVHVYFPKNKEKVFKLRRRYRRRR